MRWGGLIFLCCVFGGAGWLLARKHAPADSDVGRAVAAPREPAASTSLIFAGGIVEGSTREVAVRPEVAGRIQAVHVQEGDQVRQGDLLATLESDVASLNLMEAQAQLDIALAERKKLEPAGESEPAKALPRVQNRASPQLESDNQETALVPLTSGMASPKRAPSNLAGGDWRSAVVSGNAKVSEYPPSRPSCDRNDLLIAEARVRIAEAAVRRQTLVMEKSRVRSPVDGMVSSVAAELGAWIGPNVEIEPFDIVDRSRTKVRAFVEELDAMRVAPGQRALVAVVGKPKQRYLGSVVRCSPFMRPKSHRHLRPGERIDVRVREVVIELDDGSDLLLGLPVEVSIQPNEP